MKWYHSINVQISILIVIINTIILVGFGSYEFINTKNKLNHELDQFSQLITERLSRHLILPIWGMDKKQTEESVNAEMLEKRIYAIIVRDNDGKSIFLGKMRNIDWDIIDVDDEINGNYINSKKEIEKDNKVLGSIEVYITKKFMEMEFNRITKKIIIQVAVLDFIIFMCIYLLINVKIISLVKILTRSAEKMSVGDLHTHTNINVNNEIGLLALAIDRMKVSLGIAMDKLKNR